MVTCVTDDSLHVIVLIQVGLQYFDAAVAGKLPLGHVPRQSHNEALTYAIGD
ncbi:MAG TPA: hypothetical protein VGT43_10150 [Burkholderiales bacterium]|nr:hypothetical protein [Burkholderiales bacterium]